MRDLGQDALFRIRAGDEALDADLAAQGYRIVDPTNIHAAPVGGLTVQTPPRVTTFAVWEPLEIMREIWAEGGIGPARIAVMERARGRKPGFSDAMTTAPPPRALSPFTARYRRGARAGGPPRPPARGAGALDDGRGRALGRAPRRGAPRGAVHEGQRGGERALFRDGLCACGRVSLPRRRTEPRGRHDQTRPTTALDLQVVDPLPEDTQKYFDICEQKSWA